MASFYSDSTKQTCKKVVIAISVVLFIFGILTLYAGLMAMRIVAEDNTFIPAFQID